MLVIFAIVMGNQRIVTNSCPVRLQGEKCNGEPDHEVARGLFAECTKLTILQS
jgi:hypothetical protein